MTETQARLPWDQTQIAASRVLVVGGSELAHDVVWGFQSLGVQTVYWMGQTCRQHRRMAQFLTADPPRIPGTKIIRLPGILEWPVQIEFATSGQGRLSAIVIASTKQSEWAVARDFAERQRAFWVGGAAGDGGHVSYQDTPPEESLSDDCPVAAMGVAAQLIDAFLWTSTKEGNADHRPPAGPLGLRVPPDHSQLNIFQAGVGGIGVYCAYIFAALGNRVCFADFDCVDRSNFNRQGLYSIAHAERSTPKAVAAEASLARLFPLAQIQGQVARVDLHYVDVLRRADPAHDILVSALDNAKSRLDVQRLGEETGKPVIQGGTSLLSADVVTQIDRGRTLDEQLHGAMSAAVVHEAGRIRTANCTSAPSYVVPSMIAGAMVAYRAVHTAHSPTAQLPVLRWRSGSVPTPDRSKFDDTFRIERPLPRDHE